MSDSTCATVAPTAPTLRSIWNADGECNEAVRLDLARLAEMELPGLTTQVLHGDPHGTEHPVEAVHPAVAQMVSEAMFIMGRLCREGRPATEAELITFRFLGARCAHAGLDCDEAGTFVAEAAESVMDVILRRARELDDLWGAENVDAAVSVLCGLLERFAARTARQIEAGYKVLATGLPTPASDTLGYFLRVLDGRPNDAEAAEPVRDPERPYAVVLVVAAGHREDAPALATAAREIEVHVPGALDMGLGDDRPTHRRLVVPVTDPGLWRDAHPVLRHVAVANGVVIVTRPAVRGASALRACYEELTSDLRTVIREHGRQSGVVPGEAPPDALEPQTAARIPEPVGA